MSNIYDEGNLALIFNSYGDWANDTEKMEYVDKLESFILHYNEVLEETGSYVVSSSAYDTCKDYLRLLKPLSPLLTGVWESKDEELDMYLSLRPMVSTITVRDVSDKSVTDFKKKLPVGATRVCCTLQDKGIPVRVVWKKGDLVKATSKGISSKEGELTEIAQYVLGSHSDAFEDLDIVEMRGELVLPLSAVATVKKYSSKVKDPVTGMYAMLSTDIEPEDADLLHFVFNDIMTNSSDLDDLDSLSSKLGYASDIGFNVPLMFTYDVTRSTFESDIEEIVYQMENRVGEYDYYSTGVVVTVDNNDLLDDFGVEDMYRSGQLLLNLGKWRNEGYQSQIEAIVWVRGDKARVPMAKIRETVTDGGVPVNYVPLYAPCYILMLEAYRGNTIHFKHGGDAGAVPTLPDGRLVRSLNVSDMFPELNVELSV